MIADREQIEEYVDVVFGGAPEDGTLAVCVRTIGEKGTPNEGRAQNYFTTYNGVEKTADYIEEIAERAEEAKAGTFIVPGLLKASALEERRATEAHVDGFWTICVDIDGGDIEAAAEGIARELGPASMRVMSGGTTDNGQQKTHIYYRLDDYERDIERVKAVREDLAKRYGGDVSFKRAPQVIRVPGTAHLKHGVENRCAIVGGTNRAIKMPAAMNGAANGSLLDAATGAGKGEGSVGVTAMTDVHEGGTEEKNRWSAFTEIAGHYIHQSRIGNIDLENAKHATKGWMRAHMKPAWPDARFESEWKGLLAHDLRQNGPMPKHTQSAHADAISRRELTVEELGAWRISQFAMAMPAPRRWLVDGLVPAGKRQMLAAPGGAGKSYAVLELGLQIAACKTAPQAEPLTWMGFPVNPEEAGVVVILSCEDDKDEVTRRLHELDPVGARREAAGDNLIVIPTDNIGGAFPLVAHDKRGQPIYSDPWHELMQSLKAVRAAGRRVALVAIDTLNATLHGEENSAQIASEYISAVSPVVGELGAALLITHHMRKTSDGHKVSAADAVRGSNALVNAMRNVIAITPSPEWGEILPLIGRVPVEGDLFELSVVKGNVQGLLREKQYLVRSDGGYLEPVTRAVKDAVAQASRRGREDEVVAWISFCIKWAVGQRQPYTVAGERGVGARMGSFPQVVQDFFGESPSKLTAHIRTMKARGELVEKKVEEDGKAKAALDVPGGELSRATALTDLTVDYSTQFKMPDFTKLGWDPETGEIRTGKFIPINARTEAEGEA